MRTRKFRRTVAAVFTTVVMLASVPLSALAQTANTGVITGVVKDQQGAVVAGATVKATNKATGIERRTTTSDAGTYELSQLIPADYKLEVEAQGFAKYVQESVTVNVLSRVTVDVGLKPAGAAEQVTVTSESVPLIETTKTEVSGVINQKQMESLPVNGRSFASLATLIPGATLQGSFDPTKARVGTFSVGGSTGRNINITIDGGDNKDNAVGGILQNFTMEGIQEFALSTQRFSAANGRSGGGLLSVVSKSGSNSLHGSGFGFFRHDTFNSNAPALLAEANPDLFDPDDAVKPPFNRQQFGGSVGGPIMRDKLFFFGVVEHTRERGNSIVPTFAFNEIKFLEQLGYEAVRFLPQPFNDTQYTAKVDYSHSANHNFSFRFAGQNNNALNDQAGFLVVFTDLSGGNESLNDLYSFLGNWTWTASPRIVNQFTYQFSDFNNRINATTDKKLLFFPSGIAVGRNGNVPQQTLQRKHQFRDDLTWNRGKHGFKFGGDFTWEPTLGGLFAFLSAAEYDFALDPSQINALPRKFNTPGVVVDIILAGGNPSFDLREGAKLFGWYVQDDWKVSQKFTLNFGVRYDVDIGYVDAAHQSKNRTFRALQIIGHPLAARLAEDDKNNFSPRIGFAWDVKGTGKSVIRGGYGWYYDQSFLNVPLFAIQMANDEIYALIVDDADGLSLASPPPPFPRPLRNPPIGFPVNGRLIDPNYESPYTQQFNIGFAQELGRNASLEFDYVHVLGLHEFTQTNANPRIGPLIGANRTSPNPGRLLTPQFAAKAAQMTAAFGQVTPFTNIRVAQSDGRSRYDAFTIAFKKRYANKFQLNAHYTLSRAVAWFGQIADFGVQPQNPFRKFDPLENFGFTGEDERHRFVVNAIIDLPWDVQVAPILQLASARPYSIFAAGGADINKDGVLNDRETRDGNDQNHLPPGTERGDSFKQVNLRVSKYVKFKESMKLGLFFEAFNLFNTGNFGNSFGNTAGTPNLGKPVNFFGATGFSEPIGIPFQAQFGFRFTF
ncbi:MAG TPA: TonB-dependent receptor [Blastocatellia bacterium]|nr:TonB-dependent receptor [Blastocatellia bacterium]